MRNFFKDFFKKHRVKIIWFSFLRIISLLQLLFWPFAFAKTINIMTQTPDQWQKALLWVGLMIVNKVLEDISRLRSKLGLEKIAARLKICLATFFIEKTKIREKIKTGEAVQAIRQASDAIESIVTYYKDSILQLPINLILIPIILLKINSAYFNILIIYAGLYLIIDYFAANLYNIKLQKYLETSEMFWGTTYRKTPEVWRQREDGADFANQVEGQGEKLYQTMCDANTTDNWRWMFLQTLSSISTGCVVLFVFLKVIKGSVPIGDLILVTSYFQQTQETLNIVTTSISQIIQTKISLRRLNESVEIKI